MRTPQRTPAVKRFYQVFPWIVILVLLAMIIWAPMARMISSSTPSYTITLMMDEWEIAAIPSPEASARGQGYTSRGAGGLGPYLGQATVRFSTPAGENTNPTMVLTRELRMFPSSLWIGRVWSGEWGQAIQPASEGRLVVTLSVVREYEPGPSRMVQMDNYICPPAEGNDTTNWGAVKTFNCRLSGSSTQVAMPLPVGVSDDDDVD